MREIRILYPGGKIKAVSFSYDDGVNYDRRLIEILNGCGMKGTFNLNSGVLTETNCWPTKDGKAMIRRNNADEVARIYEGHEVAIHGLTHAYWTAVPRERALYEIQRDKANLERLVGYAVRGIAYPYASYDQDILAISRALGMRYGRIVGSERYFQLPQELLLWQPTCTHNAPNLMERARFFLSETFNTMALFCVQGHTFEFANDHNWRVIEEFCDFMCHRDEIWYATNVEIFDYVHAAKQLICTADCSILHNPTATVLSLEVEGRRIELHSGETLRLGETVRNPA